MLENITATQFAAILSESATLRQIMAERVLAKYKPDLKPVIVKTVLANGKNKIAAIKAVRALAPGADIRRLFGLPWDCFTNEAGNLGLADSKRLVEYVAAHHGNLYENW